MFIGFSIILNIFKVECREKLICHFMPFLVKMAQDRRFRSVRLGLLNIGKEDNIKAMSKRLAIYVHEFQKEVGHSRALIEILQNFDQLNSYDEIHVVAYDIGDMADLRAIYQGHLRFYRVPKFVPMIFLVKAIFFQIYCYILSKILGHEKFLKISMGTAILHADVSYVQFIQEQAAHFYFENYKLESNPLSWGRYFYKKILFFYFILCERILFFKKDIKIICCGKFMEEFLAKKYCLSAHQLTTVYSSVNIKEFSSAKKNLEDLWKEMCKDYPVLRELNLQEEIYLFVGAFERKGLVFAINAIKKSHNKFKQFIVVGMPEAGKSIPEHEGIHIFWIPYTKEISKFYELAGVFIFPTIYEPFGLVIIEAFSMGLKIYVTKKNVGACELISVDEHMNFIDDVNDFKIKTEAKMSSEIKTNLIQSRRKLLNLVSWEKSAQEFFEFIN